MGMVHKQTYPDNNRASKGIVNCAGNGCKRKGKIYLRILFVNKSGWFCTFCERDLKEIGLVDSGNLSQSQMQTGNAIRSMRHNNLNHKSSNGQSDKSDYISEMP